ncbi:hypothetical protein BJ742DRAFT_745153 [Cladochytrium replicatum]|nr:hypothetical protein BJ742DRAFT_745153 [Cladochytrium replicatum]
MLSPRRRRIAPVLVLLVSCLVVLSLSGYTFLNFCLHSPNPSNELPGSTTPDEPEPENLQEWMEWQTVRSLKKIRTAVGRSSKLCFGRDEQDEDEWSVCGREWTTAIFIPVRSYVERAVGKRRMDARADDPFQRIKTEDLERLVWEFVRFSRKFRDNEKHRLAAVGNDADLRKNGTDSNMTVSTDGGAALRSLVLAIFAQAYLRLHNFSNAAVDMVRVELYGHGSNGLLSSDLEQITTDWRTLCVDLWGDFCKGPASAYYSRFVQLFALRVGAEFAAGKEINGQAAAQRYVAQALEIRNLITQEHSAETLELKKGGRARADVSKLLAWTQVMDYFSTWLLLFPLGSSVSPDLLMEQYTGVSLCGDLSVTIFRRLVEDLVHRYPINTIQELPAFVNSHGDLKLMGFLSNTPPRTRRMGPAIDRGNVDGKNEHPLVFATIAVGEYVYMCSSAWSDGRGETPTDVQGVTMAVMGFLDGESSSAGGVDGQKEDNAFDGNGEFDVIPGAPTSPPRRSQVPPEFRGWRWSNKWTVEVIVKLGDAFLRRVQFHAKGAKGELRQVIDGSMGTMMGKRDGLLSHVALTLAMWRRRDAVGRTDWDE